MLSLLPRLVGQRFCQVLSLVIGACREKMEERKMKDEKMKTSEKQTRTALKDPIEISG